MKEVNVKESQFKLFHAIENRIFITLSSEFFLEIVKIFYDEGAFQAN